MVAGFVIACSMRGKQGIRVASDLCVLLRVSEERTSVVGHPGIYVSARILAPFAARFGVYRTLAGHISMKSV